MKNRTIDIANVTLFAFIIFLFMFSPVLFRGCDLVHAVEGQTGTTHTTHIVVSKQVLSQTTTSHTEVNKKSQGFFRRFFGGWK